MALLKNIDKVLVDSKGKEIVNDTVLISSVIMDLQNNSKEKMIEILQNLLDKAERLTIKDMLVRAINFEVPSKESNNNADLVMKKYKLMQQLIHEDTEIDMSVDDMKLIKNNLAKMTGYGTSFFVAGQVIEAIEGIGKEG